MFVSDSPNYLPAKSYAKARVIVGVDAASNVQSQSDPLPVVLRIVGPARSVAQNGKVLTTRIDGCLVNGAARGDLSSEKVYVKQIGRAHVCTPVTNAHHVCRLLLEKTKKHKTTKDHHHIKPHKKHIRYHT